MTEWFYKSCSKCGGDLFNSNYGTICLQCGKIIYKEVFMSCVKDWKMNRPCEAEHYNNGVCTFKQRLCAYDDGRECYFMRGDNCTKTQLNMSKK